MLPGLEAVPEACGGAEMMSHSIMTGKASCVMGMKAISHVFGGVWVMGVPVETYH